MAAVPSAWQALLRGQALQLSCLAVQNEILKIVGTTEVHTSFPLEVKEGESTSSELIKFLVVEGGRA